MATAVEAPTGYRIEQVDLASADEALMRRVVALVQDVDAEMRPEDPPEPYELVASRYRSRSPFFIPTEWVAFAGEQVVGRIAVVENKSGSNEDKREIDLGVHPEHRRRGVGRALFAAGVRSIPDEGTRLVEAWTTTRVPAGEAFAERLGATKGLHMRVSQLDLAKVDSALMREWASLDPNGYRIEFAVDDVSDRLLQPALEAFRAINRMPREQLDMDDWVFSEATLRDWERIRRERGRTQWLILAIDEATGQGAGFTNVVFDRRYEHLIHQGGTAVDPAHQGHGLGKWMKARMVERLLRDMPKARFIRTDNAGTNAPMLSINDRMGFRETWYGDVWQLALADAKRYAA